MQELFVRYSQVLLAYLHGNLDGEKVQLYERELIQKRKREEERYVFTKYIIILNCIFDFMKVVFIQLHKYDFHKIAKLEY